MGEFVRTTGPGGTEKLLPIGTTFNHALNCITKFMNILMVVIEKRKQHKICFKVAVFKNSVESLPPTSIV